MDDTTELSEVEQGNLPSKLLQNLTTAGTMKDARSAAQLLMDSGALPAHIKTPEQVLTITKYGHELGLEEMTALNSLYIVQGRITMSYQLMGSLLKKHNYEFEVVKDFEPVKDDKGQVIVDKNGEPANYETIIRFTWVPEKYIKLAREFNNKDLVKTFVHEERRTYNEFVLAGFVKNRWKDLPKLMMRIRTFAFGARFVAPEALHNVYETSEFADAERNDYKVDPSTGQITFPEGDNNSGGVDLDEVIIIDDK